MDSAVPRPGDETGSSECGAALPESHGDSRVQTTHQYQRQEIEEYQVNGGQYVLIVLLDVGYAHYVDAAGIQFVNHRLNVDEFRGCIYSSENPNYTDDRPQSTSRPHRSAPYRMHYREVSLRADDNENHYTRGVGERVDEHVSLAEKITQRPARHQIVRQGLVDAEYTDAEIGHCQVGEKEVCDAAQLTGECNHQYDDKVTLKQTKIYAYVILTLFLESSFSGCEIIIEIRERIWD